MLTFADTVRWIVLYTEAEERGVHRSRACERRPGILTHRSGRGSAAKQIYYARVGPKTQIHNYPQVVIVNIWSMLNNTDVEH